MSPSLLIVEPYAGGHHPVWVRWITACMSSCGWRVVVATGTDAARAAAFSWVTDHDVELVTSPVAADHNRGWSDQIYGNGLALLRSEVRRHRLIRALYERAISEHQIDLVLLPFGDYVLHAVGLFGSPFARTPWTTILMRPVFHHSVLGVRTPRPPHAALRRLFFQRFLRCRSLTGCLTIDESLYQYMQRNPRLAAKAEYLPDPAAAPVAGDRLQAGSRLGIPDKAIVVLVFGSLSERKGLQQLLTALGTLGRDDVHALLVGVADEDARRLLEGSTARALMTARRLHVIDRWVDDETERMAFTAADIAWLGYSGHWRSSGVQVQSALSGLPMVACDEGLIGWLTERHQCGLVVPVQQESAVAGALSRLASSPELRRCLGERGREAFAQHSLEKSGAVLSASLTRALGLQTAALSGSLQLNS